MQKNIKLAIPAPCHEKWNSFVKTDLGGFCGSCQKEVIDFTGWSEDRLKAYFKKPSINACGRFKQEQLKVYTFEQPSSKVNWLSFAFVSMLLLFSSRQASANAITKTRHHTEQLQPEIMLGLTTAMPNDSSIVLRGKVFQAEDSVALPGVNVTLKGTGNTTVTDADGNFMLNIKSLSPSAMLVVDFIGLQTTEYKIDVKNILEEIQIIMEYDVQLSGEVIVVGGVVSTPWYSPRRWWWGVKRCFRN
jgi:hypothetical protein